MTRSSSTSSIVIDANVAVWVVLPMVAEEAALDLLADWHHQNKRIVAPEFWLAEVASVIRRLMYHKVITSVQGEVAVEDLFALGVETVPLDLDLCRKAFRWAERLQHSKIYDSLYLALAEHLQAEFWTGDKRLANGARQRGVNWVYWIGENE